MEIYRHGSREKKLAVITAGTILIALLYAAVVKPQLVRYGAARQKARQLELQLLKMRGDMLLKDKTERDYAQLKPLMGSSGTDQQEISRFTGELSELYGPLRVKVKSVKILPVTKQPYHRKLAVKIGMSGKTTGIARFVELVEQVPKPVRIEKLSLQAKEVADTVEATLVISKVVAQTGN